MPSAEVDDDLGPLTARSGVYKPVPAGQSSEPRVTAMVLGPSTKMTAGQDPNRRRDFSDQRHSNVLATRHSFAVSTREARNPRTSHEGASHVWELVGAA